MSRAVAFLLLLGLAGCESAAMRGEPSLARRSAEAIDPRLPVEVAVDSRAADAGLVARVNALLAEGRSSAADFAAAEPRARAAAAAAGAPESESWVAAQLALSELQRTRAPLTRALAEIDEMRSVLARSTIGSPADAAVLDAAAEELRALGQRQVAALDSIRATIRG